MSSVSQFWSAYVPCDTQYKDAVRQTLEQIDVVHRMCQSYPEAFMFATSSAGKTLAPAPSPLGSVCPGILPSSVTPALRRHPDGLQREQDSQPDRRGGGSLPWQQSGDPAHHVPVGGPIPDSHTLLQHTLVRGPHFCPTLTLSHYSHPVCVRVFWYLLPTE